MNSISTALVGIFLYLSLAGYAYLLSDSNISEIQMAGKVNDELYLKKRYHISGTEQDKLIYRETDSKA